MENASMPSTADNALASAARDSWATKLAFDGSRILATKLISVGAIFAVAGLAVGGAFWAYSAVLVKATGSDEIAAAITQSLSASPLRVKTDGVLTVDGAVSMAADQFVKLRDGATVNLEQPAPVQIQGTIDVTALVANVQGRADSTRKSTKITTSFTVFKKVSFGAGEVMTGWNYENSQQTKPSSQYCYYTKTFGSNDSVIIRLMNDGIPADQPAVRAIDLDAASAQCIWFQG